MFLENRLLSLKISDVELSLAVFFEIFDYRLRESALSHGVATVARLQNTRIRVLRHDLLHGAALPNHEMFLSHRRFVQAVFFATSWGRWHRNTTVSHEHAAMKVIYTKITRILTYGLEMIREYPSLISDHLRMRQSHLPQEGYSFHRLVVTTLKSNRMKEKRNLEQFLWHSENEESRMGMNTCSWQSCQQC